MEGPLHKFQTLKFQALNYVRGVLEVFFFFFL
jgi:hypothetical protein